MPSISREPAGSRKLSEIYNRNSIKTDLVGLA
jgi:hypothetical protein